jgi:hypothetical protein
MSAAPALAPTPTDSELAAIRALVREYWAAVTAEVELEGCPGHKEACERSALLRANFEALAGDVQSRPVTSWLDVVKRGEFLRFYYPEGDEIAVDELAASDCPAERALGGLLDAVLTMGAHNA